MPSFAIEVAGEANPLTESLLVHSLRSAASSDPYQIQTGTKQLQQWEKAPGYYKHLQSAYLDRRLSLELRHLAVIQLKNGIDKYWRKNAQSAVSKDDKNIIRSRLLDSALNEPDDRLALQNALLIAKIARFEYPQDWPDAIPSLVQTLRNASHLPPLHLARALLVLLHVVKELSTGRLQRSRQNLQAATPEIVHVLARLYSETVNFWCERLQEHPTEAFSAMKLSHLTIKSLRRLLVSGYDHPNRESDVSAFWSLTQQYLGDFMTLGSAIPGNGLLEKNTLQLAKLHCDMAKEHPAAFMLLPHTVELVKAYWTLASDFGHSIANQSTITSIGLIGDIEASDEKEITETLALKGLLILRACVKVIHNPAQSFKSRTLEDKEEKVQASTIATQQLLTVDLVQVIMETLVTKFFAFRASDLREWHEEPDEWEKREEADGEDWEFSIRSCSEKLFLDLAINYREGLVQPLLNVFYSVATPGNEDVLFKDSVYTAIGLAAPILHEQLDFDAFIRDVLTLEVQKQNPGFNIIRRRAAIILGQWISVRVSEDSRKIVYEIFSHLLDPSDRLNDRVVRVTAGRQFAKIVDDWETKADLLVPFADGILTRIMLLITEIEVNETKMALLNTISVMVERLEYRISPFAERIVGLLPPLWEGSGQEHLMKSNILVLLARLVNAMKADSLPLHKLVYPIVKGAIEPGSETQVYLLDDALDLWATMLVQTPSESISSDVLQLVEYLFPMYDLGSDSLRKALEITESYLVLTPAAMLSQNVRSKMMSALASLLGTLRPDANGLVCSVIEVAIRAAQKLGGDTAVSQFASDLAQPEGVLPKLLAGLRESWIAHCTTGPLAKAPSVDGIIETDYLSLLARLILGSLDILRAIEMAGPSLSNSGAPESLDTTMKWLLEEWFSHFENIGDPSRRKLMCLALTRLLETNQRWILTCLQPLMTMWTDVITELREGSEDPNGDSLVYPRERSAEEAEVHESPEDVRRRELTFNDEVHTVKTPEYVKTMLGRTIQACGGRFEEEWLVNVDKEVVKGFSDLGIM